MTPALRFYRHGDGGLCLFNGSGEGEPVLIESVLAQADARGRPLKSARHSGFERLQAGRTLILMDAGPPPGPGLDQGTHAGTLSFEMSVGRERMIVNCGAWPGQGASREGAVWQHALRGTAAHSTAAVDGADSSVLIEGGGLDERPASVTVDRQEVDGAVLIEASHDGYVDRFGITHHRRLYVSAGGEDVRGEDRLDGPAGHPFTLRFHLHPLAQVLAVHSGEAALIRLASGAGFRLRATGAAMSIEESVYFGANDERRRSSQIVLTGATGKGGATVKWALRRERKG
jgi:uncharacterized heparinase superfamily protein